MSEATDEATTMTGRVGEGFISEREENGEAVVKEKTVQRCAEEAVNSGGPTEDGHGRVAVPMEPASTAEDSSEEKANEEPADPVEDSEEKAGEVVDAPRPPTPPPPQKQAVAVMKNRWNSFSQTVVSRQRTMWRRSFSKDDDAEESSSPSQHQQQQRKSLFGNGSWTLSSSSSPSWKLPLQAAQLSRPAEAKATAGEEGEDKKKKDGGASTNETTEQEQSAAGPHPSPAEQQSSGVVSPDEDRSLAEDEASYEEYSTSAGGSTTTGSWYTDSSGRPTPLQWAAATVVDSVNQQVFRGRYSRTASGEQQVPPPRASPVQEEEGSATPSQTIRILNSPQATHMQQLMQRLQPHEYLLLLGRGMLGVNLKQCYRAGAGVYVDYLVKPGAAAQSGVVYPGDLLVTVGDVDVSKGTIETVPQQIASAKRPVHLTLSTAVHADPPVSTNHVDVAIALLHQIKAEPGTPIRSNLVRKRSESSNSSSGSSSQDSMEAETGTSDDNMMELVQPCSFDACDGEEANNVPIDDVIASSSSSQSVMDAYVNPGAPPVPVRECYFPQAAKRNTDCSVPIADLCQKAASDTSFRAALRNAFLLTVMDGRRFPFLVRSFSMQADKDEKDEPTTATSHCSAMLMLFLEMMNYADLHPVMPYHRQKKMAVSIAYKFFLPTLAGRDVVPPMFDFHHIVADPSLRQLEMSLKSDTVPRDLFLDFAEALLDSLATERPFLSFLVGQECARMRAYLRNTAPFCNIPLHQALKCESPSSKNFLVYSLLYLLCMTDRECFGEHDDVLDGLHGQGRHNRVEEAASGLTAALFIRHRLLPVAEATKQDKGMVHDLIAIVEQFWEMFVDPTVGALAQSSRSAEAVEQLNALRAVLQDAHGCLEKEQEPSKGRLAELLVNTKVVDTAAALAEELIFEYAVNVHSRFRMHKFHEWMCDEMARVQSNLNETGPVPPFPKDCIKRLLRKADLPPGISAHKPSQLPQSEIRQDGQSLLQYCNAECAVVFGTSVGLDLAKQMASPAIDRSDIRRYNCQSVALESGDNKTLTPAEIPATLESYAVVPPQRSKPFGKNLNDFWKSEDGWEVSLINFMIPRADSSDSGDDSSLFGASLVFQRTMSRIDEAIASQVNLELVCDKEKASEESPGSSSPVSGGSDNDSEVTRKVKISGNHPTFSRRLSERSWSERISREVRDGGDSSVVIGLALVSQRNVILAMRDTLSRLLHDFSRSPNSADAKPCCCGTLVELLGNFSHQDVEAESLKSILEPFLRDSAASWIERPQKDAFEEVAGQQLISCLPPIPLALLFVTALLEQKIVLSSSRRSVLMSCTVALSALLKPLKWCHLLVPRVPAALASDLLQYPAPFVLGMPSEDPGIMDLIRDLPADVTLVDLDVGRVIVAPSFAHDNELGRGIPNDAETARVLRSQVLYLAQSLGGVFGTCLDRQTWSCDSPFAETEGNTTQFARLRSVCNCFIEELLAGTASCCYWIEEASAEEGSPHKTSDSTVLFDEDRFFHIKNARDQGGFTPLVRKPSNNGLALSLNDFDLVLELFLRCQSMNAYIGTMERNEMVFAL